jgi:hypothetical protein
MRLSYSLPDTLREAEPAAALPDSFAIFIFNPPESQETANPTFKVTTGRLHQRLPCEAVEGRLVCIAAWKDGLLGPKSEAVFVDVATEVEPYEPGTATELLLEQNYPNPFNAATRIVTRCSGVLTIYDILGRTVRRLMGRRISENQFEYEWDGLNQNGTGAAAGIYFYRLEGCRAVGRMVLLK